MAQEGDTRGRTRESPGLGLPPPGGAVQTAQGLFLPAGTCYMCGVLPSRAALSSLDIQSFDWALALQTQLIAGIPGLSRQLSGTLLMPHGLGARRMLACGFSLLLKSWSGFGIRLLPASGWVGKCFLISCVLEEFVKDCC